MGRIYRRLGEMPLANSAVVVRCRRCGRQAIFKTHKLASYFRIKNWNDDWSALPPRFRCARPAGCDQRRPEVWYAPKQEGDLAAMQFTGLPSPAPPGVPQVLWNMARSEIEQRQLIRRARG